MLLKSNSETKDDISTVHFVKIVDHHQGVFALMFLSFELSNTYLIYEIKSFSTFRWPEFKFGCFNEVCVRHFISFTFG